VGRPTKFRLPATFLQITATAKKGVKKAGDDRQAGRVVFKGAKKNSSQFTLDSSYEDIEDEYESALELKRKKESVKLQVTGSPPR
jgi:hypothetical protein